jgi:hypothetical protein
MDIHVVSPLWIDQCKQAKKRVSETDFLVSSEFNLNSSKPSIESKLLPNPSKFDKFSI